MTSPWPDSLSLPETSNIRPPHLEISASGARHWVSSLPYANPQQLAATLLEQIHALNRYTLAHAQRAAVMATYQAPLNYLDEHIHKGQARKHQDSLCDGIGQLYQALATGYLHILRDQATTYTFWGKHKLGAQAITYALYYQLEQIQLAMQSYAPCPPACKFMHTLYQMAETEQWLTQALPHPWREQQTLTPLQIYQTYLLLALVDTYRLTSQEHQQLHSLLPSIAPKTEILSVATDRPAAGHFLIDLQAEHAIQSYAPPKAGELSASRYRLLSTTTLVQSLETAAIQAEAEPADFLRRLARAWQLKPKRRNLRNQQREATTGTYGLNNLYPLLGGLPLSDFADNPHEHNIQAVGGYGFQSAASSTLHTWHCEGRDPEGTTLYVPLPAPNFAVGQLILLRPNEQTPWSLGIVRWQRTLNPTQLKAGIQFLPGKAQAVALRYRDSTLAAISLPGQQLLVARGLYHEARSLSLMREARKIEPIRADRLVESSGYYEHFCYKPA